MLTRGAGGGRAHAIERVQSEALPARPSAMDLPAAGVRALELQTTHDGDGVSRQAAA